MAIRLKLFTVPVGFTDGTRTDARAEGNNATWHCRCGHPLPLIGRCYFQFGKECFTRCPHCRRDYRVLADSQKRTKSVEEFE